MDTSKIIKGVVGGGRYTVTAPIVKEDYGLYLQIEGIELPETYEVDFSNDEHSGTSVTMIGNADGVLIPNQFISTGKDIFAFLYHVGDNYGRTVFKFRIPNKLRPDRTDETPTPEEQSVIDQTIAALNDAVDRAEDAQEAIENMSVSAQTLAEGSSATVTKTEQGGVVHLNFGIPVGATGAQGERGEKGDKGDKGDQGEQGIQGIQGEKGEQGIQGEKGEKGDDYVLTEQDKQDIAELNMPDILKAFPTDTASGSIASFTDGADGLPLKSLVVDINPIQDLHGYDHPWVAGGGKNLLDPSLLKDQAAWNIIPIYAPVGTVLTMSTNQPNMATSGLATYFRTPGGTQGASENVLNAHPITKTVGEERYLEIVQRNRDNIKSYADYEYQIEVGSTATDFEPYENICPISGWEGMQLSVNGTVIPISWQSEAGTVYGGKLDILSGVLMITHGIDSFKNLTWTYQSANTRFYSASLIGQIKAPSNNANVVNAISESYKVNSFSAYADKQFSVSTSGGLFLKDSSYTDVASFVEAMGEYQICYELATPLTVQLDAHALNSLYGQNNIFADTGDAHVEYRADTRLYIEKLTQPEEDDMIADSAITSGQFFMVGNSLYRALTNIASGATITVGTNAQRVSLSDALNLVNV